MNFRDRLRLQIEEERRLFERSSQSDNRKTNWRLYRKVGKDGRELFYYKKPGEAKYRYINRKEIVLLRQLCVNGISGLEAEYHRNNIVMLEELLNKYKDTSAESVLRDLPPVYAQAWAYLERAMRSGRNAELVAASVQVQQSEKGGDARSFAHTTTFGLKTRSKGESMIGEQLYFYRLPVLYEKRTVLRGLEPGGANGKFETGRMRGGLETEKANAVFEERRMRGGLEAVGGDGRHELVGDRYSARGESVGGREQTAFLVPPAFYTRIEVTIFPDFTIPLPNGKVIYWEHKGMLGDREYAINDYWRTQLYFHNGIYEPHNLISTYDGPDGGTDMQSIKRIVEGIILPQL